MRVWEINLLLQRWTFPLGRLTWGRTSGSDRETVRFACGLPRVDAEGMLAVVWEVE